MKTLKFFKGITKPRSNSASNGPKESTYGNLDIKDAEFKDVEEE